MPRWVYLLKFRTLYTSLIECTHRLFSCVLTVNGIEQGFKYHCWNAVARSGGGYQGERETTIVEAADGEGSSREDRRAERRMGTAYPRGVRGTPDLSLIFNRRRASDDHSTAV